MIDWKLHRKLRTLFSRYDEGIRVNDTMLYSVTPESIALALAQKIWSKGYKYVVDGCGGCGGNSIAFAEIGFHVALVELNADTLEDAKHNADVYECREWIQFFHSNILRFSCFEETGFDPKETFFFASPEWGGPGYIEHEVFDLEWMNPPLSELLDYAKREGYRGAAVYVPRTSDVEQARRLGCYEFEYLFFRRWCKAACLWFDLRTPTKEVGVKRIDV